MAKTTIQITGKHIAEGGRCSASKCALALAINARLKAGFFASVGVRDFYIFDSECCKVFGSERNEEITRFVDDFDDGCAEPTRIILFIPDEFLDEELNLCADVEGEQCKRINEGAAERADVLFATRQNCRV